MDGSQSKQTEEAPQEEEWFRLLAENAQDLVYWYQLSPFRRCRYINPAAFHILGYHPEEFYADPDLPLKVLHPEELPGVIATIQQWTTDCNLVIRCLHKRGNIVWLDQRNVPVRDPAGNVISYYGIARDITEQKQIEQYREEYTYLISHDLRNPLTALMGYAQLFQRRLAQLGLESDLCYVERMLLCAKRMNSMIQDLVESAHLISGQIRLIRERVDLCQILRDIVDRVGSPEDRSRIELKHKRQTIEVLADAERIERVLANLLTNALKYSPKDSRVLITAAVAGQEAVVSVADEGPGIDPNDLPYIFERFFRGREQRSSDSLGLGLYIARKLVETHSGHIWVDSTPGKGSTFHFTLPLYRSLMQTTMHDPPR